MGEIERRIAHAPFFIGGKNPESRPARAGLRSLHTRRRRGDFGLASGKKTDGTYERMWFQELVASDEVAFEAGVFLLRKATAESLRAGKPATPARTLESEPGPVTTPAPEPGPAPGSGAEPLASRRRPTAA